MSNSFNFQSGDFVLVLRPTQDGDDYSVTTFNIKSDTHAPTTLATMYMVSQGLAYLADQESEDMFNLGVADVMEVHGMDDHREALDHVLTQFGGDPSEFKTEDEPEEEPQEKPTAQVFDLASWKPSGGGH